MYISKETDIYNINTDLINLLLLFFCNIKWLWKQHCVVLLFTYHHFPMRWDILSFIKYYVFYTKTNIIGSEKVIMTMGGKGVIFCFDSRLEGRKNQRLHNLKFHNQLPHEHIKKWLLLPLMNYTYTTCLYWW